jgi:hypothetical protein
MALQLQVPVAGNLFHHAVELFLKAAMSHRVPVRRLASRNLGHDLEALWGEFKVEHPKADESLLPIVETLNRFEDIRYPVAGEVQCPQLHLAVFRHPEGKSMGAPGAYALVLEDVDRLVQYIVSKIQFNKLIKMNVEQLPAVSRQALSERNLYALPGFAIKQIVELTRER